MWCNERRSPLDNLIAGRSPNCFCEHCRELAARRGIDVERARIAFRAAYDYFQAAQSGAEFDDGAFVEFLRILYHGDHALGALLGGAQQDMDRELYGISSSGAIRS